MDPVSKVKLRNPLLGKPNKIDSKSILSFSETQNQLQGKLKMANETQLLIVATFALIIPFICLDVLAYDGYSGLDPFRCEGKLNSFRCGDKLDPFRCGDKCL